MIVRNSIFLYIFIVCSYLSLGIFTSLRQKSLLISSLQYSTVTSSSPTSLSPLRTLLIDNYDSYTYNIWQLLADINGVEPYVVYNNDFDGNWDEMLANLGSFDNIVLSPGPGRPDVNDDFGLCHDAILKAKVPLLGVCLGHQGLGWLYGGCVVRAPRPMHGRISRIYHTATDLFQDVPQGTEVVRYHSLVVANKPPELFPSDKLEVSAWTSDGTIMGLKHKARPQFGVQFHPESIKTSAGRKIFENFRDITIKHAASASAPVNIDKESARNSTSLTSKYQPRSSNISRRKRYMTLHRFKTQRKEVDTMELFRYLFGDKKFSFFLDKACAGPDMKVNIIDSKRNDSRLSYLGAVDTEFSFAMSYDRSNGCEMQFENGSTAKLTEDSILGYLKDKLSEEKDVSLEVNHIGAHDADMIRLSNEAMMPAYFGYLGYEIGQEIFAGSGSDFGHSLGSNRKHKQYDDSIPDALLMFPSRYVTYDHETGEFSVISFEDLYEEDYTKCKAEVQSRVQQQGQELVSRVKKFCDDNDSVDQALLNSKSGDSSIIGRVGSSTDKPLLYAWKTEEGYRKDIETCLEKIQEGETYEVCLTVQFQGAIQPNHQDFLTVYEKLRKLNPAPHAAFLKADFGLGKQHKSFAVCCTSPEQYLKIDSVSLFEIYIEFSFSFSSIDVINLRMEL